MPGAASTALPQRANTSTDVRRHSQIKARIATVRDGVLTRMRTRRMRLRWNAEVFDDPAAAEAWLGD